MSSLSHQMRRCAGEGGGRPRRKASPPSEGARAPTSKRGSPGRSHRDARGQRRWGVPHRRDRRAYSSGRRPGPTPLEADRQQRLDGLPVVQLDEQQARGIGVSPTFARPLAAVHTTVHELFLILVVPLEAHTIFRRSTLEVRFLFCGLETHVTLPTDSAAQAPRAPTPRAARDRLRRAASAECDAGYY